MKKLVDELSKIASPCCNEGAMIDYIKIIVSEYSCDVKKDNFGNLIVHKKGDGKSVAIACGVDDISFFVTGHNENGTVCVQSGSPVKPESILYQRVIFSGLSGVIIPNKNIEKIDELAITDFVVDFSFKDMEEAKNNISVGDFGTLYCAVESFSNVYRGFGIGTRFVISLMLKLLEDVISTDADIYLIFSPQSRISGRGGKAILKSVDADIFLELSVTNTDEKNKLSLSKGPVVRLIGYDYLINKEILKDMQNCSSCDSLQYEISKKFSLSSRTQGDNGGVAAATLSVPAKFEGFSCETVNYNDVEKLYDIIRDFVKKTV